VARDQNAPMKAADVSARYVHLGPFNMDLGVTIASFLLSCQRRGPYDCDDLARVKADGQLLVRTVANYKLPSRSDC